MANYNIEVSEEELDEIVRCLAGEARQTEMAADRLIGIASPKDRWEMHPSASSGQQTDQQGGMTC